eukprot:11333695-Alexandrium_andersonii.AAC.1
MEAKLSVLEAKHSEDREAEPNMLEAEQNKNCQQLLKRLEMCEAKQHAMEAELNELEAKQDMMEAKLSTLEVEQNESWQ